MFLFLLIPSKGTKISCMYRCVYVYVCVYKYRYTHMCVCVFFCVNVWTAKLADYVKRVLGSEYITILCGASFDNTWEIMNIQLSQLNIHRFDKCCLLDIFWVFFQNWIFFIVTFLCGMRNCNSSVFITA